MSNELWPSNSVRALEIQEAGAKAACERRKELRASEKCSVCMFSAEVGNDEWRICRREPPKLSGAGGDAGIFPWVDSGMWCGEFKRKEQG